MTKQANGFWSSIQGILTGFAAVITAITGLYIAINGNNSDRQEKPGNVEITSPPPAQNQETTITPKIVAKNKPAQITQQPSLMQTAGIAPYDSNTEKQFQEKPPFPETGPLIDCAVFPSVNTVASLMSWSDHYHKQVIAAKGVKSRATEPCNKTIDMRGMAHCKATDNPGIRLKLLETLTLCRAAGIEWTDITHSTITGNE
jgi:hypothetical protein